MTATELSLWMSSDIHLRTEALADLISSGDLIWREDDAGGIGVIRAHHDVITRFEAGALPALPPAAA